MKKNKTLIHVALCILLILSLAGCSLPFGKKNSDEQEAVEEIDTNFTASTNITYSAGSDSDWSYGNQRKEFPQNEACYARIGSTIVAEKKNGIGNEITITYKFTGAKDCKIELSDGIASKTDSGDPDVAIFTRTVKAEKAKNAKEGIVIFQYNPGKNANSVVLEVSYDDHVPGQYDVRNSIYFSEEETEQQDGSTKESNK